MQIILLFPSGVRHIGLLSAAGQDWMRVVLPGIDEALELRRVDTKWISETGERVEIEAILADK